MTSKNSSGYIRLLKNNRSFRNLWYGQVVSELGSWLNSIAIFALILKLGGSGMAMATAMMAKLLPFVIVSPLAGVIVDRVSRRSVMIVSDVLRFFVVLGFLFIGEKEDLWLLYVLVVMEVAMAGFFEPARSAIIPSITDRKDLVTANALSGSTWSVMLAFGAALGGVLVALFGIRTAFIIDAFSFLLSGWFISRIPLPIQKEKQKALLDKGFKALADGARYLVTEPIILGVSLLKSGLAISGGIMTLIPLYSHQMHSPPAAISMGIGVMFSARGIGAAIGPIIVRRLFGDSSKVLRHAIAFSFFLGTGSLFLFAKSHTLLAASLSIGLATLFGSIIWVFSSALLHLEADERYLGRIFSTEIALLTLVMAISNWGVGFATDRLGFLPQEVALGMASLFLIPGLLWTLFLVFVRHRLRQGKCVGSTCPVDPSGFNPTPTTTPDP